MLEGQQETLLSDIRKCNLTKYIPEVVSTRFFLLLAYSSNVLGVLSFFR